MHSDTTVNPSGIFRVQCSDPGLLDSVEMAQQRISLRAVYNGPCDHQTIDCAQTWRVTQHTAHCPSNTMQFSPATCPSTIQRRYPSWCSCFRALCPWESWVARTIHPGHWCNGNADDVAPIGNFSYHAIQGSKWRWDTKRPSNLCSRQGWINVLFSVSQFGYVKNCNSFLFFLYDLVSVEIFIILKERALMVSHNYTMYPYADVVLISLFTQAALYGLYVATLIHCLRWLLYTDDGWKQRDGVNRIMLTAAILIFLLSTINLGLLLGLQFQYLGVRHAWSMPASELMAVRKYH
jgi:hypothetical protein